MGWLPKFWALLNGKKTVIASLYWGFAMSALPLIYPAGVPSNINKYVTIIGLLLTALGVGHKWYKSNIADKEQE